MKSLFFKYIAFALFGLLCLAATSRANITDQLTFSTSDFDTTTIMAPDTNYYVRVTSSLAQQTLADEPGEPHLPAVSFVYSLPQGFEIDYVSINSKDTTLLASISHDVFPRQELGGLGSFIEQPDFIPPNESYQLSGFPMAFNLAAVTLPLSFSHGMGFGVIQLRPIIYDITDDELWLITNISFTIYLKSASRQAVIANARSVVAEKTAKRFLKGMVENAGDVDDNTPQISVYSYNYPTNPDDVPAEYLIFAGPEFAPEFAALKYWKTAEGCKAEIIVLDEDFWADPEYQGQDNAETLRNYMIAYKEENHDFNYALLAGNYDTVPLRYAWPYIDFIPDWWNLYTGNPCDLYYADIDGNWNTDGDEYWGELGHDSPDVGPDIYVGRVPVERFGDATNWIEKTMRYVEDPGYSDPSYLRNVMISSMDDFADSDLPQAIGEKFSVFFDVDTESFREWPSGHGPNPQHPLGEEFISYFGNPTPNYFIGLNYAYGDYFVTMSVPGHDLSIVSTNPARIMDIPWGFGYIGDVNNEGREYITSIIGNFTGLLDARILVYENGLWPVDTCYAQLNLISDGGSFAGSCNTRSGLPDISPDLEISRIEKLMDYARTENRFGLAHYMIKVPVATDEAGLYVAYSNTLFGDPEFAVHVDEPGFFMVDFPAEVELDSIQPVTIRVRDAYYSTGIPDVLVTLWKEGEIYERGFTNVTGYVGLTLFPTSPGTISIVCSKPHFIPFSDSIAINAYCTDAVAGDANGSSACTGQDVTFLTNYFKGLVTPPDSCMCPVNRLYHAADASGDCSLMGSDVTYLVYFFRGAGPAPLICSSCPGYSLLSKRRVISTEEAKGISNLK